MYSLDLNLLRERSGSSPTPTRRAPSGSPLPLLGGLAIAVVAPVAVLGLWWKQGQDVAALQARRDLLNSQLIGLRSQAKQVEKLQQETARLNQDADSLASIFTGLRSWSALLTDLAKRTPRDVQITTLDQPGGGSNIQLQGQARSYDSANDLLLSLQRSPLYSPTSLGLQKATRTEAPAPTGKDGKPTGPPPPALVSFTISGSLSTTPATQLLPQLSQLGANGLVARIQSLQRLGVLKP